MFPVGSVGYGNSHTQPNQIFSLLGPHPPIFHYFLNRVIHKPQYTPSSGCTIGFLLNGDLFKFAWDKVCFFTSVFFFDRNTLSGVFGRKQKIPNFYTNGLHPKARPKRNAAPAVLHNSKKALVNMYRAFFIMIFFIYNNNLHNSQGLLSLMRDWIVNIVRSPLSDAYKVWFLQTVQHRHGVPPPLPNDYLHNANAEKIEQKYTSTQVIAGCLGRVCPHPELQQFYTGMYKTT